MQERGEGKKRVHTAVEREWNEKIGEAVPSACLSPLLLQCLWFIGGMMAGQGKGQLWRFGRRSKQGKAGDWFVIVVLCGLLCQQAALLTAVIEKSNSIHISACHVPFISSYVSWVFLYRKRKEEAAVVMSGLKRWRKESGGNATSSHLGALVAQRISSYFPLALSQRCGSGCRSLSLHLSVHHRFGLYNYAFINTSSACAHFPADG